MPIVKHLKKYSFIFEYMTVPSNALFEYYDTFIFLIDWKHGVALTLQVNLSYLICLYITKSPYNVTTVALSACYYPPDLISYHIEDKKNIYACWKSWLILPVIWNKIHTYSEESPVIYMNLRHLFMYELMIS